MKSSNPLYSGQNEYVLALYGSSCGNTDAMINVSQDWQDYLWSYLKTVLFFNTTESYIEKEQEYLECYNMTHGDFHGVEENFREKFRTWVFPDSCPTDFDKILQEIKNQFPSSSLSFPKRDSNPFQEIIILLLQIQLRPSKENENEDNWGILIDKICELNSARFLDEEDVIFLRFSVHFFIILYSLQRVSQSKVEKYNELLIKYINLEEEIDAPTHTFYLNFLIGDKIKVDYYSDIICGITDEVVQKRIMNNIDLYTNLRDDLIESIRYKIINNEKSHSSSGSNIKEVAKKLLWLYSKNNYTEFYKSVVEMARRFLKNDALYRELKDELNHCEQVEELFQQDGFYKLLTVERQKHRLLVQIEEELIMFEGNLIPSNF